MTFCNVQTSTHGKWILAGEHAVLRGHTALVYPVREKTLTLTYESGSSELTATYGGSSGDDLHLLFWSVLEQGQNLLGQSVNRLSGHFHLESNIPVGVGMGASAALCVAMARWFRAQNMLVNETVESFAKNLENLFHGQSSGLDIAGVAAEQGVCFRQGQTTSFPQVWQPCWYLSSCGQIGITSHCINQVSELRSNNQSRAAAIDLAMQAAVDKALLALSSDTTQALPLLTEAIHEGGECFKSWGLVSDTLSQHMSTLLAQGALAVKPTGSGGGGYVLSLWKEPPSSSSIDFIVV